MWSSPAVAGPRLHLALQQALQRAVDPSGQASQSDLEHWLDGASGALGRLRLQFAPREGCPLRAPSSLPVPDPDEPETAADLEASDLAIVDVRRGVLARLLLGRFETDAAACGAALATHALVHALADIARHPVTWSQARSTLRARTPALRHSSELGMDRLLGALLELAALSTGPVGTPAFDIDLQLELGPTGLLYQPLDPSREDSPSVPVGRCAACGVFGLAMAQSDDGLTAEGARVHRVWAAEGSHRRFLVRGVGLGASQCPVCGSSAVGLLNVPGPALAGLCADLFPAATGAGCPPLPAAAMPVARRCTLRRALVELIGESVPGPSLVQLRERLRRERSAVAAGWSEDQLEWAIYDELGQHSGHALSAERLGLSAVHLAPKAAELMATALAHKLGQRPSVAHDHAVRGAARLMRHAGAIASTGLDRWLKGGRNGLLLPRPFGGGGRSPDVLEPTGQLAARCRDLIRRSLGVDAESGFDPLPAFVQALESTQVGRRLKTVDAVVLEPGALRCTRDASALGCRHGHRRVDIPAHLAGALTGAPCPHPGCSATLAAAPRAWDPLPQLCATGLHTPTFETSDEPGEFIEFQTTGSGARLRVRITASAAA